MKRSSIYIAAILVLGALAACSPEEIVVGDASSPWRVFVSTEEDNSSLALVSLPSNTVENGTLATPANGSPGTGSIRKMINHRDYLYVLVPDKFRIDVISLLPDDNFRQVDTLWFTNDGESGLVPADMTFGTAITGYICFSNSNDVLVLDATTIGDPSRCQICDTIPDAGFQPSSIAYLPNDNRLFMANMDNTVSILSTRDNSVLSTIQNIPTAPLYIAPTPSGSEIVVVSAGAGKLEGDVAEKTESEVTFIDPNTESVVAITPFFDSQTDRANTFPTGLAISERDFAFIASERAVYRLNIRDRVSIRKVLNIPIKKVIYNAKRDEVILVEQGRNRIRVLAATGSSIADYTLSVDPIFTVVPR